MSERPVLRNKKDFEDLINSALKERAKKGTSKIRRATPKNVEDVEHFEKVALKAREAIREIASNQDLVGVRFPESSRRQAMKYYEARYKAILEIVNRAKRELGQTDDRFSYGRAAEMLPMILLNDYDFFDHYETKPAYLGGDVEVIGDDGELVFGVQIKSSGGNMGVRYSPKNIEQQLNSYIESHLDKDALIGRLMAIEENFYNTEFIENYMFSSSIPEDRKKVEVAKRYTDLEAADWMAFSFKGIYHLTLFVQTKKLAAAVAKMPGYFWYNVGRTIKKDGEVIQRRAKAKDEQGYALSLTFDRNTAVGVRNLFLNAMQSPFTFIMHSEPVVFYESRGMVSGGKVTPSSAALSASEIIQYNNNVHRVKDDFLMIYKHLYGGEEYRKLENMYSGRSY